MFVHMLHLSDNVVDDELILGPFEGVKLTYDCLRDTGTGDNIAIVDGCWFAVPVDGRRPFTDVVFSDEKPDRRNTPRPEG